MRSLPVRPGRWLGIDQVGDASAAELAKALAVNRTLESAVRC